MTGYDISFYGSHNAALAISKDKTILEVIEIERFINTKNNGVSQYQTFKPDDIVYFGSYLAKFITNRYGIENFDNCYYQNTDVLIGKDRYELEKLIPANNYVHCLHHEAHAAGAFYQSDFKKALIFSFDGGGNDGFFNIYYGSRKKGVELLESVKNPASDSDHLFLDLGFPYMTFGHYIEEIKQEVDLSNGNLVYPGKLMGLAAFGKVRKRWIKPITDYYKCVHNGQNHLEVVKKLGDKIGLTFDRIQRLPQDIGRDLAATSQKVFEDIFIEIAKPYFNKYPDIPVCIAGGCGLNIILNTRISEEFNKDVFVGPNPNDCGLAAGMLLNALKPQEPSVLTYSGMPLVDIYALPEYIHWGHYFLTQNQSLKTIVEDLIEGKIIGLAHGRSEHGPRALGNRSIICNPAIKGMKDILNAKVKNREPYRPFAPVVRLEDVNKYFEWNKPSPFMSFCPKVKKEWKNKLKAIVHKDGTARIQTVTKDQNAFLYDLLTLLDKETGVGVILNTSFNVAGKPILNSIKDAFEIFQNTEMDCLLVEETYMQKIK